MSISTYVRTIRSKMEQAYRLLFVNYLSSVFKVALIVEYPKSGGTWLGQLVSDYFGLPFPRNSFPRFESALFHSHYVPNERILSRSRKILWLVRDGRDVMVSSYYHSLIWNDKNALNPKDVLYARNHVPFEDYDNVEENMPAFLQYKFEHTPSRVNHFTFMGSWDSYNRKWHELALKHPERIFMVRYEDLLEDTEGELKRIVEAGFGEVADLERLKEVVGKYSFARQANRQPGEVNPDSFLRKGISGDWKNYFSAESRRAFAGYAGGMLVELGYESDDSWAN